MTPQAIENIVNILGKFKDLKRSGWLRREVSDPESVADHSYAVALLTLLLAPKELNRCHCLELALTHDLQEIYAGDMLPGQQSKEFKHAKEGEAVARLAEEINFPQLAEWFAEFEALETPEACFVRAIDKMESALSAVYYHNQQRNNKPILPEFVDNAAKWVSEIDGKDKDIVLQLLTELQNKN